MKKPLERLVSRYTSYRSTQPASSVTIRSALETMRNGKYRSQIEKIRQIKDKSERDIAKSKLPAFTFAGCFTTRRNDALSEHSGVICLDVDQIGEGYAEEIGEILRGNPNVLAAGRSASGIGWFALVPVNPIPTSAQEHREAFAQVCLLLNIDATDTHQADVSRLRGCTHDPSLYINEDARPVCVIPSERRNNQRPAHQSSTYTNTEEEVREVLSYIIDRPDYDQWIKIASGVLDKLEGKVEKAERLLIEWRAEEQADEYRRHLMKPLTQITFGTVVHIAKSYGYNPRPNTKAIGQGSNTGIDKTKDQKSIPVVDLKAIDAWLEGEIELDTSNVVTGLSTILPIEYDKRRKRAADLLECRVGTLDDMVVRDRPQKKDEKSIFEEPEPWPEPVNSSDLIAEIKSILLQYVVFSDEAATACALWVLHTYTLDAATASPILAITSPEKRCGKTTLLSILSVIVYRPAGGAGFSRASVYRVIEKYAPTLLIDEADTFLSNGQNDELRGVINSGHTRRMAYVWVCVGDNHEPTQFSTWGAKAIACIGILPDTIADRSIEVSMRRKTSDDRIKRFRERVVNELEDLRRRCKRWADDNLTALTVIDPEVPESLSDRAADSWSTLLAIADIAGEEWSIMARAAANQISGSSKLGEMTTRTQLLFDINKIFKEEEAPVSLPSSSILYKLNAMEERPWPTYTRGKELTARGMADLLKPFGITSTTIRLNSQKTAKGYKLEDFEDSFSRYLADLSVTTSHFDKNGDSDGFSVKICQSTSDTASDEKECVTDRFGLQKRETDSNSPIYPNCYVVTDKKDRASHGMIIEDDIVKSNDEKISL